MLNIFINNQALDLFTDEIFTLSLQAGDIITLESKADFSKSINIPTTQNNRKILGLSELIQSTSKNPYRQLSTKVVQDGVELVGNGITIIEESQNESFYKITIYGGNINAIDILRATPLRSLDLSALDFEYTVDNAAALANTDTGVLWPLIDYEEVVGDIYNNALDIREGYFAVYVETILQQASIDTGITISGLNKLTTPPLEELLIPLINKPQVTQEFKDSIDFVAELSSQQIYSATIQTIVFDVVLSGNQDNEYNPAIGVYQSTKVWNVEGRYLLSGTKAGTNGESVFIADTGDDVLARYVLDGEETEFDIEIPISGTYTGASVQFRLQVTIVSGDTIRIFAGSRAEVECSFDAATYDKDAALGSRGSVISVSGSLPEISALDLLNSLKGFYNLIIQTDNISNTVSLQPLDEFVKESPLDWSGLIDRSRDYTLQYRSGSLAQFNDLVYTEDEELGFEADGRITVDDNNIPIGPEVLVQSIFAASPQGNKTGREAARINLLEPDEIVDGISPSITSAGLGLWTISPDPDDDERIWRVNDVVEVTTIFGAQVYASVVQNLSTSYRVRTSFNIGGTSRPYRVFRYGVVSREPRIMQFGPAPTGNILFFGGGDRVLVSEFKVLNFKDEAGTVDLTWSKFIEDNFNVYQNMINNEKIIEAFFNLDQADIASLTFQKPVFVEVFNALFYLQKVDRYRIDQTTKVRLLRL